MKTSKKKIIIISSIVFVMVILGIGTLLVYSTIKSNLTKTNPEQVLSKTMRKQGFDGLLKNTGSFGVSGGIVNIYYNQYFDYTENLNSGTVTKNLTVDFNLNGNKYYGSKSKSNSEIFFPLYTSSSENSASKEITKQMTTILSAYRESLKSNPKFQADKVGWQDNKKGTFYNKVSA